MGEIMCAGKQAPRRDRAGGGCVGVMFADASGGEPQRPRPVFQKVGWILVNSGDKLSWKEVKRSGRVIMP